MFIEKVLNYNENTRKGESFSKYVFQYNKIKFIQYLLEVSY